MSSSIKVDPERTARAIGRELPISPKKSMELCREIRGMKVSDAKRYLEQVIAGERAVPFKRYNRDVPHRKGKGMMSGRYPRNAAMAILKTIEHAEHNADYKGFDAENMMIYHIAAHRGQTTEGRLSRAHGRATSFDHKTTNVDLVLQEEG